MDISLHSFIILIGLVVMAFILWDGYKKVRASRANKLRIKLDDQFDTIGEDRNDFGNEFPNGGARTLADADDASLDDLEFNEAAVDEQLLDAVAAELNEMDFMQPEASQTDTDEAFIDEVLTMPVKPLEQKPSEVITEPAADSTKAEEKAEEKPAVSSDNSPSKQKKVDAQPVADNKVHASEQKIVESKAAKDIPNVPPKEDTTEFESITAQPSDRIEPVSQEESLVFFGKTEAAKEKAAPEGDKLKIAAEKAKRLRAEIEAIKKRKQNHAQAQEARAKQSQTVDDGKPVPMLMESIELGESIEPNPPKQVEMSLNTQQVEKEKPPAAEQPMLSEPQVESFSAIDDIDPLLDDVPAMLMKQDANVGERLCDRPPAQEVLVINVLKTEQEPLLGSDLAHIFQACDLRHGEMGIFHRFEQANAQGKIQFSVANGVEPGTFDPNNMDQLATSGISFFMSLPGPERAMDAFDAMVEVAHVFARNFNAELHDESHSDLTPQTIEHCRQRIREFSRKQKMAGAQV